MPDAVVVVSLVDVELESVGVVVVGTTGAGRRSGDEAFRLMIAVTLFGASGAVGPTSRERRTKTPSRRCSAEPE